MPETIETDLGEQPAAPPSSGLEQQLAVMQEQIANLARTVQRLNGDPDAPVTRADLFDAIDQLRAPQAIPATASRRQLSDADVSAIADAVLDGLDEQLLETEEPTAKTKGAKPKTATSGKRQADEGPEEQPRRRGYFPEA